MTGNRGSPVGVTHVRGHARSVGVTARSRYARAYPGPPEERKANPQTPVAPRPTPVKPPGRIRPGTGHPTPSGSTALPSRPEGVGNPFLRAGGALRPL